MSQTGTDFTDTFRIISEVKTDSMNLDVIENLLSICTPLSLVEKDVESGIRYIELLLKQRPEYLEKIGMTKKKAEITVEKFNE